MFLLQEPAGGSQWSMPVFLILIFVVMYFFMIRPQRKKEKELQKKRDELKKNDDIVTAGGIHGKITEVDETTVVIATEGPTRLRIEKSSISTINGVSGAAKR